MQVSAFPHVVCRQESFAWQWSSHAEASPHEVPSQPLSPTHSMTHGMPDGQTAPVHPRGAPHVTTQVSPLQVRPTPVQPATHEALPPSFASGATPPASLAASVPAPLSRPGGVISSSLPYSLHAKPTTAPNKTVTATVR